MRYLLILLFFSCTSLFAQENQLVKQYSQDSSLLATGVINNQMRQGLWKIYDAKTNKLVTSGTFENGQREGTWTSYFPNGKKWAEVEYKEGKLFGPSVLYDEDGYPIREMIFKDSILVGKYVEYYGKTGRPAGVDPRQVSLEGSFEEGKRTGQWIKYFFNGVTSVREFYEKGLREGPYLEYDSYGNLILEGNYRQGQMEGIFKRYAFGNQVYEEGEYKNGKKVGKWIRYFPETKVV
ncbi:MAG: toxin-antitoxin system YwqK family antitoxin, partial [Cyclobacteriaceae bacterium]|nr:toxin-antitoxin system YwqK family antitoxin [Cyclobacteriaceae bacterium]